MSRFISYIAFIGALASNLPHVVSLSSSSETCPDIELETVLDFENALNTGSTLGNEADGELRFQNVGNYSAGNNDIPIDLVVKQAPNTTYTPWNLARNGKNEFYGMINVRSTNGEGTFDFCFENHDNGETMTLGAFFFSFLDIDGHSNEQGFETVGLKNDAFTEFYVSDNTEITQSENDGFVGFTATTRGIEGDNPQNPDELTDRQQDRGIVFQIENTDCFQVKLSVNCVTGCNGGRNFLFTGNFKQIVPCEVPVTPSRSPTIGGAYGDPHIKTWTGKTYDFHGVCDLVLFSNPSFDNGSGVDVHIRNKRINGWSFIETGAIRIGKDTFELTGGKDNDNFLINGIVQKVKNKNGVVGSISGYDIKYMQVSKKSRKFMINLGTNQNNNNLEEIVFTTWNSFVSVSVQNPTKDYFDGSLGLMGSFPAGAMVARDGKTVFDDSNEFGQEWQVLNSEPELFAQRGTVGPNDMCSIPSNVEMRRRLQASVVTLKEAENVCNTVNKEMKDLCIFDVMATNDKSSSGAY